MSCVPGGGSNFHLPPRLVLYQNRTDAQGQGNKAYSHVVVVD
jgi:hypothetical protein